MTGVTISAQVQDPVDVAENVATAATLVTTLPSAAQGPQRDQASAVGSDQAVPALDRADQAAGAAAAAPAAPRTLPAATAAGNLSENGAANAKRQMTARTLEAAIKGQDVRVLTKAIEWAIRTGVQTEAVERARKRKISLEESARKEHMSRAANQAAAVALEAAMCGTDAACLESALAQAVEAGVSSKLLNRAKRRKITAGRQQMRERAEAAAALEHATIGADLDALASAIDWAATAGVDPLVLAPAQRRKAALEEEESRRKKRREAITALTEAQGGSNIEMFAAAIDLGVQADVDNEILGRARQRRESLEKEAQRGQLRSEVMQALESAAEGSDMQQLDNAICRAVYAGISCDALQRAQRQKAALQQAMQKQLREQAASALQFAMSGVDIKALSVTLAQATDAGLAEDLLLQAREKLAALRQVASNRSRQEAISALESATKLGGLEALCLAINAAERVGVETAQPILQLARQRRVVLQDQRRQEALESARCSLERAATGADLETLRRALTAAMRAGVGEGADTALLWQAKQRMAILEGHAQAQNVRDAAQEAIQSAMGSYDVELIGQAIQKGADLGVDTEVLCRAQRLHASLLRQAAPDDGVTIL